MICRSKTDDIRKKAFSLVEVLMALAILALISSSVLVVIDRCVASAAASTLRMRAFEVARENMEKLLASASVKESIEYGESEKYPDIGWQTVVETFYEPITARMWIRGVCSAQYNDPNGQEQTVELTNWLTDLTKAQLLQLEKRDETEQGDLSAELIETMEDAADYAGVDVETIEQWLQNGLLTTEDGSFIKNNLDLYMRSNGNPSPEEKNQQAKSVADLKNKKSMSGEGASADQQAGQDEIDPKTGLTYGELEKMDFSEIWDLMQKQRR
jgi:prepilin-type N-terminal cleavage/methylation domain-containing protein